MELACQKHPAPWKSKELSLFGNVYGPEGRGRPLCCTFHPWNQLKGPRHQQPSLPCSHPASLLIQRSHFMPPSAYILCSGGKNSLPWEQDSESVPCYPKDPFPVSEPLQTIQCTLGVRFLGKGQTQKILLLRPHKIPWTWQLQITLPVIKLLSLNSLWRWSWGSVILVSALPAAANRGC